MSFSSLTTRYSYSAEKCVCVICIDCPSLSKNACHVTTLAPPPHSLTHTNGRVTMAVSRHIIVGFHSFTVSHTPKVCIRLICGAALRRCERTLAEYRRLPVISRGAYFSRSLAKSVTKINANKHKSCRQLQQWAYLRIAAIYRYRFIALSPFITKFQLSLEM